MKIIYFGTPKFSANILSYLFENKLQIVAVVTQPDIKRNSRKNISEVKMTAHQYLNENDIYQPQKASDPEFLEVLRKYNADLFVVVAYGQILKQALLDIPSIDCINVHASLLPKYRGAAPINHAILNGEKKTGITIMKMVRKMDAGPMISQKEIDIPNEMVYSELQDEMCLTAKPLLLEVIEKYRKNDVTFTEQDESLVTMAPKITKEMREINFNKGATEVYNQIRAFAYKQGAFCKISINNEQKELKVFKCKISDQKIEPKKIIFANNSIFIGCLSGSIELIEVQIQGKKQMKAQDFLSGLKKKFSIYS